MVKLISIYLAVLSLAAALNAKELQVDKSQTNSVKFISDAPLEDFEGITQNIDGYVFWKGADTLSTGEFYFEVDLNTIDTGIGLRNRHMRENYLETDKYRFAKYGGKLRQLRRISNSEYEVTVTGMMKIHGVERTLETIGKVTIAGGTCRLQCDFVVKLTDYKIKVPKLMFMKIDERMQLKLDFYLKEVSGN